MIWYNKYLKKIAFRNKIDVLTNQIVRFIHQKLMNLFKKNGQFPDVYWLPTYKFPLLRELGVSKIELNFNEDDKIKNFAFLNAITHFSKSYSFQRISEIEIPILWNPNNFNNTSWSQIYLELIEMDEPVLNKIILAGYKLLKLETFFTSGPKETRAWTIHRNSLAPQAAGVIHTDFERGFIKAEVISYEDFINCCGESGAKRDGKLRLEGKDYLVKDGDVIHVKFNV